MTNAPKHRAQNETDLVCRPSLRIIFWILTGLIIFSTGLYMINRPGAPEGNNVKLTVLYWCLEALMVYVLLTLKWVRLNKEFLVLSYPLIFYKRTISIADITKIEEENATVMSRLRGRGSGLGLLLGLGQDRRFAVYSGKKIILTRNTGRRITIGSLETANYGELVERLRRLHKENRQGLEQSH